MAEQAEEASVPVELLSRAVNELRRHARDVHQDMHNGTLGDCDQDSCPSLVRLAAELDATRPRPLTAAGLRETLAIVRSVYDVQGAYEPTALAALAWGERAAARISELESLR